MNDQLIILIGKRDCLRQRVRLFNRWRDRFDLWLTERRLKNLSGYGGHKMEINSRIARLMEK